MQFRDCSSPALDAQRLTHITWPTHEPPTEQQRDEHPNAGPAAGFH
jgi:hypothetical protein